MHDSSFLSQSDPLVLFVAFPGMGLLDLLGSLTVFWAATAPEIGPGIFPSRITGM